ncbi:hypothetical protein HELRODRAFT_169132 [Helobdella robusta]|uniref:PI3K regulatory subunit p85-related inter-SH2 domain-containing protein n=1 Tax=Helobdella robusta TaxID=6412 RepID=T1F1F9_HELRO|nr:hypothetical protein HELRODRAFT_169132 [Helobdella robusta]ESO08322.1 hypothetical protein HELRODRAFT_169132 [Helobdella robusta]
MELMRSHKSLVSSNMISLEEEIKDQVTTNRNLISAMNSLKPELKRLQGQRDQLKKFVNFKICINFELHCVKRSTEAKFFVSAETESEPSAMIQSGPEPKFCEMLKYEPYIKM